MQEVSIDLWRLLLAEQWMRSADPDPAHLGQVQKYIQCPRRYYHCQQAGLCGRCFEKKMEREHGIHITDDELRLLLPRFHAWADLAYDGWNSVRNRDLREYYTPAMAQAIEAKGPKTPKYFVLQDAMLSHRSTSILTACVRQQSLRALPRYPGVWFDIGSECFNAILSMEENSIFAELLASQKKYWGCQTLGMVRVFRGDGDEGPTFVWNVHYYDEQMRKEEGLAWADATSDFRGRVGG